MKKTFSKNKILVHPNFKLKEKRVKKKPKIKQINEKNHLNKPKHSREICGSAS